MSNKYLQVLGPQVSLALPPTHAHIHGHCPLPMHTYFISLEALEMDNSSFSLLISICIVTYKLSVHNYVCVTCVFLRIDADKM